MRNDARPIGEKLREMEDRARQVRGGGENTPERARESREPRPFASNQDKGDEEPPKKS